MVIPAKLTIVTAMNIDLVVTLKNVPGKSKLVNPIILVRYDLVIVEYDTMVPIL